MVTSVKGRRDTTEEDRIAADGEKTKQAHMGIATSFQQGIGSLGGSLGKAGAEPAKPEAKPVEGIKPSAGASAAVRPEDH